MPLPERDKHQYTYADYLTWPDTWKGELIDGTAYVREPPAPSVLHQCIAGQLYHQAVIALKGKSCRVYIAPVDIRLPKSSKDDDKVDTVLQPDVFIVCELQKVEARGMCGSPDWVAEVLSPNTARYDQRVKLPVYERAGVREAWLIHPINRTVAIYRLEAGRYGHATVLDLKGRTQLAAVPSVTIDWDELLAEAS
jgi:Uma2 family endonuclease